MSVRILPPINLGERDSILSAILSEEWNEENQLSEIEITQAEPT